MLSSLVLTVIGPDRPGIVELVSATARRNGANWEASRMARLGGHFAGLLAVSLPEEGAAKLQAELEALSEQGLRIVVQPALATPTDAGQAKRLRIELVGTDRPGIVQSLSELLRQRGINVEELATECSQAPMSGGELFTARAQVACHSDLRVEELQSALEALAADLMVDISLADDEARS